MNKVVADSNGNPVIVDWKTACRKWQEGKEHKDGQATLYTYAYRQMTGRTAGFRYDVVTKGKQIAVNSLPTIRTDEDTGRTIRVYQSVERGINAGVFIPNESFFCEGCEFGGACADWGKCRKAA